MPEIFGIEHFMYLIVVIGLMIVAFQMIKKYIKTDQQVDRLVRVIGGLLLMAIVWNRLSVSILRSGFSAILPGSFCGTSSLALSLSALFLKRNHPVFHSVAYTGMLGGLLTLVYPEFIGQADSIWYPMTISGLVHHTIMVFLILVMISKGHIIPSLKKWALLPIGLAFYMTYGLFLISVLNYSDAMYINEPILEGTPLNWFVLGLLFLPVHAAFLLVWDKVKQVRTQNNQDTQLA